MTTSGNNKHVLLHANWASVALLFSLPAAGSGSFGVCNEPSTDSSFRAAYIAYDDARFAGGNLGRENWSADLAYRRGDDWLVSGAYRGTLLDESDIGFQTNGYLHSFYFALHRLRTPERNLRWAIAPALSGSSNVTKDPEQYDADAWQFLIAAVWEWPATETLSWRAGMCADHRFGRYRAYPVIALAWRPNADWLIEAGFPDTKIAYRPRSTIGAALAVYPNGNEWYVKDETLEFGSMFEYRAWAAELSLTWHASAALAVSAIGGVDFDAEYRGNLGDGSRPVLDAGAVGRVGIEIAWIF